MKNDITQKMSALTAIDVEGGDQDLNFGRTFKKVQQEGIDIEELSYKDSELSEEDGEFVNQKLPFGISEADLAQDLEGDADSESALDSEEEQVKKLAKLEKSINNQIKMKKAYDADDKKKTSKESKK